MKKFTYRVSAGNSTEGPCGFCFEYVVEADVEPSEEEVLQEAADEISHQEANDVLSDDSDCGITELSFYVGDIKPKDLTIVNFEVEDIEEEE